MNDWDRFNDGWLIRTRRRRRSRSRSSRRSRGGGGEVGGSQMRELGGGGEGELERHRREGVSGRLDHWGSTHHVYWTTGPDKVGPWDGIKTTPQHAKKTLVAAGRMPVWGKGNHRLGSSRRRRKEKKEKKNSL